MDTLNPIQLAWLTLKSENNMRYIILIMISLLISACSKETNDSNKLGLGVCSHSTNGEWISRANGDHMTLNADCSGKLLACQQNFYYRNPGNNNSTEIEILNAGLFAQCSDAGRYNCLFDNLTDPNVLVVQCDGGNLIVYDRMQ